MTATLADQLIEGERLVCSKYNEIVMKNGKGSYHKHGNRKRCDFQAVRTLPKRRAFASNMARPYMAMTGKNAQHSTNAVMGGHCKAHGGKCLCMIEGYSRSCATFTTELLKVSLDQIGSPVLPE